MVRHLPRSKKKRIIKKWFKRTGYLKIHPAMKRGCRTIDGYTGWFYVLPNWATLDYIKEEDKK